MTREARIFLVGIFLFLIGHQGRAQKVTDVDICVYGGTSAGVIAAYTAKKLGKSVLIVEPGRHVGGLTTGGLGYTDIGNKYAVTGLARDFYRRIGNHYGKFEQWIFEPHVAGETSYHCPYIHPLGNPILTSLPSGDWACVCCDQ